MRFFQRDYGIVSRRKIVRGMVLDLESGRSDFREGAMEIGVLNIGVFGEERREILFFGKLSDAYLRRFVILEMCWFGFSEDCSADNSNAERKFMFGYERSF